MTENPYQRPGSVRASICMATYRGSRYVAEQMESILEQLGAHDEVVVVDDASPDETVEVIKGFQDSRIRIFEVEKNQGYVRSFEQAVLASRGEFIVLADQDDVWMPGRLDAMLTALEKTDVVASNFAVLGGGSRNGVPELAAVDSSHFLRNILGVVVGYRPYYGCAMAMTRRQAEIFTPIPHFLMESHDLWLALCGNMSKSMTHVQEPTLWRRLHSDNVTPRGWRSLGVILRARIMILRAVVEAARRTKAIRN